MKNLRTSLLGHAIEVGSNMACVEVRSDMACVEVGRRPNNCRQASFSTLAPSIISQDKAT